MSIKSTGDMKIEENLLASLQRNIDELLFLGLKGF